MKLKKRIMPFYQAIPKLLKFQLVSFILLGLLTWGVSALCGLLLGLTGKAAITSGDMSFIFTHWQGYAMIVLLILMVIAYVAVELNALVIYSSKVLDGEDPSVWQCIKDGFAAMKKYANLRGIIVIIYAVILAPILGLGFSVSMTSSFYVPRFIMSVIDNTPLFSIPYYIVMALLTVVAIIYCFIIHGALLDASKDKVTLFIELKGETADDQMADDAVRIVKEKGMEDQAVLISLKYGVLEYIEEKYPEMLTGYLSFISLGQIEDTPFDFLALEEQISNDETIDAIHNKGKMIMVWTVNEEDDIEYFMTSDADAIITDSVKLSGEIKERLTERKPLDIILQKALSAIQ